MKILSLFDGISCARVALERAGIPVEAYYASEVDKYAMQIAQKNYPDTIQLGDIRDICSEEGLRVFLPDIDLMILGSPCQDLSIAKKNRKGLDGERSGLFWEAIKIHKYIKPKWFIYENVNSMKQEWKDQMLRAVQEIEPSAYMIMINAALVSAQNRKRIFITNIPNVTQPEDRGILLKDILEPKVDDVFTVKPKSNTVRSSGRGSGIDDKHNWDTIRIRSINKGGQGDRRYSPEGKSVGLSALGGGREAKTGLYVVARASVQKNAEQYDNGKTPALTSAMGMGGGNVPMLMDTETAEKLKGKYIGDERQVIRKLTPIECERLQSLPDNYTEGVSNSQRYKALGNAFNCEVIKHILDSLPPPRPEV